VGQTTEFAEAGATIDVTMAPETAESLEAALADETVDFSELSEANWGFQGAGGQVDTAGEWVSALQGASPSPPRSRLRWLVPASVVAAVVIGVTATAWWLPSLTSADTANLELQGIASKRPEDSAVENANPQVSPSSAGATSLQTPQAEDTPDQAPAAASPRPTVLPKETAPAVSAKRPATTKQLIPTDLGLGKVRVYSSRYGQLQVDGKPRAITPKLLELSVGPHEIVVVCAECSEPQSVSFAVQVEKDQVQSVRAAFSL
jgi:hypothetical protein